MTTRATSFELPMPMPTLMPATGQRAQRLLHVSVALAYPRRRHPHPHPQQGCQTERLGIALGTRALPPPPLLPRVRSVAACHGPPQRLQTHACVRRQGQWEGVVERHPPLTEARPPCTLV